MTHDEYMLELSSLEWQLEELDKALSDTSTDSPRAIAYQDAKTAIEAEIEALHKRFLAHDLHVS